MSLEPTAPSIPEVPALGASSHATKFDDSTSQAAQSSKGEDNLNVDQNPPDVRSATIPTGPTIASTISQSIPAPPIADESAESTQPTTKPFCGICQSNIGKYKCTRCKLPFCSVACNKVHQENHPPDPDPPVDTDAVRSSNASISTTVPVTRVPDPSNPFSSLDTSEHLQYLFRRYPSLPQQLRAIGAETDPPVEAKPANLKEALLAKAAAVGKPKKEQWNHDVGIRKGKAALRKARRAEGDIGEGIREYTELIVHLTSQNAQNREAEALLRSQTAQRDTDLIRQLLEEEKR